MRQICVAIVGWVVLTSFSACIKSKPSGLGGKLGQKDGLFSLSLAAPAGKFGDCALVTLRPVTASGQPRTVTAAETFRSALIAPGGDQLDTVFADAGCSQPIPTLTLSPGTGALSFYVPLVFLGKNTLSAIAADDSSRAVEIAVSGYSPAGFAVFYAGATGTCVPVQVGPLDANGRPTMFSTATMVQVAVTLGAGLRVYSDANCATAVASFSFAADTPFTTLYLQNAAYEVGRISLTAGTISTTANIVLAPNPVEQITVSGPTTGGANACLGPFQITLANVNGVATGAPTAFTVTATASELPEAPAVAFFSDPGCSQPPNTLIESGGTSASFYARAAAAGSTVLFAKEAIGGIPTVNPLSVVFQ